jgi:hypothetical protein
VGRRRLVVLKWDPTRVCSFISDLDGLARGPSDLPQLFFAGVARMDQAWRFCHRAYGYGGSTVVSRQFIVITSIQA